jgi:hypothetical protein
LTEINGGTIPGRPLGSSRQFRAPQKGSPPVENFNQHKDGDKPGGDVRTGVFAGETCAGIGDLVLVM